jgi:hypothetical protein
MRVDVGQRLGCVDGGAIVLHLTFDRNRLTRFTFGCSEATVVEGEHVGPCRGETLGERFQSRVLGAAEAVRHHHHRPTVRARHPIGAEIPSVATHAVGVERDFGVAHAGAPDCSDRSVIP